MQNQCFFLQNNGKIKGRGHSRNLAMVGPYSPLRYTWTLLSDPLFLNLHSQRVLKKCGLILSDREDLVLWHSLIELGSLHNGHPGQWQLRRER